MNVIGENIKKNRLKNQLSTRDLAKIIGVSHTAVNKYEKGILSPNKKMIRKMARIFKVKTQKLVTDSSVQINIKDIKYRDVEKITKKNKDLAEYLTKEKLEKYSKLLEYFPDERFRYFEIEKFREKAAIMLSCKMAIKANMNISISEMEALINDLRKCDNPYTCPHGRPTTIFYSNYELEKMFKRAM